MGVTEKVDVLVIGAGPSGAIASALLVRKGYNVRVLEKEVFPRFSIGESLLPQCMEYIEEAGMLAAVHAVMAIETFTEDNDPYGDHSFGVIEVRGHKLFWKLDLYNTDYSMGSDNPTGLTKTRRVLTIMLAEEY